MAETPGDRFRGNASEIAGTVVTGIWMAALFTGQDWWLAAMLLGYLVVVPLVAFLYGETDELDEWWGDWTWTSDGERREEPDRRAADAPVDAKAAASDDEALDTLRSRYARGELTDEQFERKLDRLLESETLEDVEDQGRRERERERS